MGIALKFYSCVGSNHTTLDAIRDIQKRRPFTLDELDKIVVHGSQVTADHVGWPYKPEGLTSAQLNLPYCVATLLLEGDCFVDQFTEADGRRSRSAWRCRSKVEVVEDPAITARGSKFRHMVRVDVHLQRRLGRTARRARRRAAASIRSRPATRSSTNSASSRATRCRKSQQDALVQAVLGMEDLPKAKDLIRLLRTNGK